VHVYKLYLLFTYYEKCGPSLAHNGHRVIDLGSKNIPGHRRTLAPSCQIEAHPAVLYKVTPLVSPFIDAAMRSRGYAMVKRPIRLSVGLSASLSTAATTVGGFAAKRPSNRRYRSTTAGVVQQKWVATSATSGDDGESTQT